MIDFLTLASQYENKELIPYARLLETTEWKAKHDEIIIRDNRKCKECSRKQTQIFSIKGIQQTLKTTQGQLDWHLVGSDLKLPDKISEGPYWFFSQATLEKYRAALDVLFTTSLNFISLIHNNCFLQGHSMPWSISLAYLSKFSISSISLVTSILVPVAR